MPGLILHQGASVQCLHAGRAVPPSTFPRVQVSGMPVAVQQFPHTVTGCILPTPPAANGPCVTAQWVTGSLRVVVGGAMPVLVFTSQAVAVPTGTPLFPVSAQTRVMAT